MSVHDMSQSIQQGITVIALVVGLVAPFFIYAAPIPGSTCPDPKGQTIECYDESDGASAFKDSIKAVCASKGVCKGTGAKDVSGAMQALGLLNQAL